MQGPLKRMLVGQDSLNGAYVFEPLRTLGIGAGLSAVIMEGRFDRLDAPVMRLTYPDTHPPFARVLEEANLPNADTITEALRRVASY